MSKDLLNEREFELVNIVGASIASNQRDLSSHMNLSLGMTNMLIKRLITKGYIRIQQLNSRKMQYLLTPKGFSEKMRKSVKYTLKTINSISLIKEKLRAVLIPLYANGERVFYVVGQSDLSFLIDVVFQEQGYKDCQIHHSEEYPAAGFDGIILICKEEDQAAEADNPRRINLIYALAKEENVHV